MELIRDFENLNKNDAHLAGGKGASLGEMTQAGIPVPPGFVVLSDSFEQFIRETDLIQEIDSILHKVNHKEIHTVEAASENIRELILSKEMPKSIRDEINHSFKKLNTKYVAVRSSATAEDGKEHAWAGQLESYLNTTEDQVLEKVKRCWSSLFTPRAIFYRFEKGLHSTKISVAVVVQKMVESEVSGIAFSVHPVTEDHNQLIIEAGFGLGEAIVSGSVTPDSYVVEKEPRKIIDINVSTQSRGLYRAEKTSVEHGNNEWRDISEPQASSQVLSESQILELSEIILNIEKHYGFPCDIEWAFEGGKFYVVQSRPITTLSAIKPAETVITDKSVKILNSAKSLAERFIQDMKGVSISKQEGNISIAIMGNVCDVAQKRYLSKYYDVDFKDLLLMQKDKGGIVYFSLDTYRKCSWASFKKTLELKSALELQEYKDYIKTKKKVLELYEKNTIPDGLLELHDHIDYLYDLEMDLVVTTLFSESMDHEIAKQMADFVGIKDVDNFIEIATLPAFESFVIQMDQLLIENRCGRWLLADYYGVPTSEDADTFFKTQLKERGVENIKKNIDDQKRKTKENREKIEDYKSSLPVQSSKLLEYVQISMSIRDERKEAIQKLIVLIVDALATLASRYNLSYEDVSFVHRNELRRLSESSFLEELKERKKIGVVQLITGESSEMFTISSEKIKDIITKRVINVPDGQKELKGVVAQSGRVLGIAKVILNEGDFSLFNQGDVLVTSMTRPEFVPLMKKASAVVTDEGGVTCHAAIISRELGIPCIIGTRVATIAIKTGDQVEVDAEKGFVRIIN